MHVHVWCTSSEQNTVQNPFNKYQSKCGLEDQRMPKCLNFVRFFGKLCQKKWTDQASYCNGGYCWPYRVHCVIRPQLHSAHRIYIVSQNKRHTSYICDEFVRCYPISLIFIRNVHEGICNRTLICSLRGYVGTMRWKTSNNSTVSNMTSPQWKCLMKVVTSDNCQETLTVSK